MNIAVVDDEVIVQKRLQAALEKDGHSVKTYGSGEAFLRDLDLALLTWSFWMWCCPD